MSSMTEIYYRNNSYNQPTLAEASVNLQLENVNVVNTRTSCHNDYCAWLTEPKSSSSRLANSTNRHPWTRLSTKTETLQWRVSRHKATSVHKAVLSCFIEVTRTWSSTCNQHTETHMEAQTPSMPPPPLVYAVKWQHSFIIIQTLLPHLNTAQKNNYKKFKRPHASICIPGPSPRTPSRCSAALQNFYVNSCLPWLFSPTLLNSPVPPHPSQLQPSGYASKQKTNMIRNVRLRNTAWFSAQLSMQLHTVCSIKC